MGYVLTLNICPQIHPCICISYASSHVLYRLRWRYGKAQEMTESASAPGVVRFIQGMHAGFCNEGPLLTKSDGDTTSCKQTGMVPAAQMVWLGGHCPSDHMSSSLSNFEGRESISNLPILLLVSSTVKLCWGRQSHPLVWPVSTPCGQLWGNHNYCVAV